MWADSAGGVVEYVGSSSSDGVVRMEGWRADRSGAWVRSRMTLTPVGDGRVEQRIEESPDGGATWRVYFEGTYVPREGVDASGG